MEFIRATKGRGEKEQGAAGLTGDKPSGDMARGEEAAR